MASDPPVGSVNLLGLSPAQVARIWSIIEQLTPTDRDMLPRIGEPQWVGAAVPWRPRVGDEASTVRRLHLLGLVEPVPDAQPMAYRLSSLGVQVVRALHQWQQFQQGGQAQWRV